MSLYFHDVLGGKSVCVCVCVVVGFASSEGGIIHPFIPAADSSSAVFIDAVMMYLKYVALMTRYLSYGRLSQTEG